MAVSENETFTFTWSIENFSMCPLKKGNKIVSPHFVVDFLEETEWKIIMYPRGCDVRNYIACILSRNDDHLQNVKIGFTLMVWSVHSNRVVKKECSSYTFGRDSGSFDLINRKDLFKSSNGMLPKDTLTIKCEMWRIDNETNANGTAIPNIEDNKVHSKTNHCSAVTRIKIGSNSAVYAIKKFSELKTDFVLPWNVESPSEDGISFQIFAVKKGKVENQSTRICICATDTKKRNILVRGKIKTFGCPKSIQLHGADYHFFSGINSCIWLFSDFLKTKDLLEGKYFSYTGDTLYLNCELCYSVEGEVYNSKNEDIKFSVHHLKSCKCLTCPKHEYMSLYKSGEFSDVTIQVGIKTFKVHKNILSLKSDVFETMFESEMLEKENAVVHITDFDPDTVNRLLIFMYMDSLELNQEDILSTYAIAHKYNVMTLKYKCCRLLMATLCKSNICEILIFADLYQDVDLLVAVQHFICINADETFRSQMWEDLVKNNDRLAADTMLHVLTRNFLT